MVPVFIRRVHHAEILSSSLPLYPVMTNYTTSPLRGCRRGTYIVWFPFSSSYCDVGQLVLDSLQWLLFETSIIRFPDRSHFTDVDFPAKPIKPFSIPKGLSFAKGKCLFVPCTITNLDHMCRVGSSLSEEMPTSGPNFCEVVLFGGGGGYGWVSIFYCILFRHKCSPPIMESN